MFALLASSAHPSSFLSIAAVTGRMQRRPPELLHFQCKRASAALPGFPAVELETQSLHSRGFASSVVPAEVVLELAGGGKYDVALLQLLSHETKIASRVDVYASHDGGASFRLLGAMDLDDNVKSGYCARELQSAQLNQQGVTHIKIVLQKPHVHEYNLEGHVGVVGLNILGWRASPEPAAAPPQQHSKTAAASHHGTPNTVSETDTATPATTTSHDLLLRADAVKRQKEAAAQREAFDEAQSFKRQEAELRRLAEQVKELETAKQAAIAREDYDEAQRIKVKMSEALANKSQRSSPAPSRRDAAGATATTATSVPPSSSSSPSPRRHTAAQRAPPASPPISTRATREQQQKQQQHQQLEESAESTSANNPVVVPEHFWDDESLELPVAEALSGNVAASADAKILIKHLGLYTVQCLYSSDVRLRGAIFDQLDRHVRATDQQGGTEAQVDAVLKAARMGLVDVAPHVFLAAAHLTDALLDRAKPEVVRNSSSAVPVVQALVEATANVSNVIQNAAGALFARFVGILGSGEALRAILGLQHGAPRVGGKRSTLWRPVYAKLSLAHRCVVARDFDCAQWVMPIMEWLQENELFVHANDAVRDSCLGLVAELYEHCTPSERQFVEKFVKPAVRSSMWEKYNAAFVKAGGGEPAPAAMSPPSSSSSRSPQLARGSGSRSKGGKLSLAVSVDGDDDNTNAPSVPNAAGGRCLFCLHADETFMGSEDALDLHYARACPMLTKCPRCEQVIEIAMLNEHLLAECEMRANHRRCPRCHEAIAAQYFEQHVARNACLQAQPKHVANRCPLCHADIAPHESGWRKHLLHDSCPKNPRTQAMFGNEDDEAV